MRFWRKGLLATLVLLAAPAAIAQRAPLHQSFDLRVPWTPEPVVVAGKASLVYELQLTNETQDTLTIQRLEVLDEQQRVLVDLSGGELIAAVGRADRAKGDDRLRMLPGMSAVAYLSVPLADTAAVKLRHRVVYADQAKQNLTTEGGNLTSAIRAPLLLGPPLRGGPWVAIYDAGWERGHRRVLYTTDGSVKVPGRFAIDWILLGPHGGFAKDKGELPRQWFGYAADVIAVADATVASTCEGIAEPPTLAEGAAHKVPLENAAGNYVALDLGDGRYAFYEHLKPGSIRVKTGQQVHRGEVIGQLGFTGESTGPHLHFHVSDANVALAAEGLPYALTSFRILGAYTSIEEFAEGRPWTAAVSPAAGSEFPAPLSVVDFGNGR